MLDMNISILPFTKTPFSIVAIDFVVSPKILKLDVFVKLLSLDDNLRLLATYQSPSDAFNIASLV